MRPFPTITHPPQYTTGNKRNPGWLRILLTIPLLVAAPIAHAETADTPLPVLASDVQDIVTRTVGCNHWNAEYALVGPRVAEIAQGKREFKCKTLKADTAKVKKKHAKEPDQLTAINDAKDRSF